MPNAALSSPIARNGGAALPSQVEGLIGYPPGGTPSLWVGSIHLKAVRQERISPEGGMRSMDVGWALAGEGLPEQERGRLRLLVWRLTCTGAGCRRSAVAGSSLCWRHLGRRRSGDLDDYDVKTESARFALARVLLPSALDVLAEAFSEPERYGGAKAAWRVLEHARWASEATLELFWWSTQWALLRESEAVNDRQRCGVIERVAEREERRVLDLRPDVVALNFAGQRTRNGRLLAKDVLRACEVALLVSKWYELTVDRALRGEKVQEQRARRRAQAWR